MRWKFEREDLEIYKCCFCCHVRTGTLILGIIDLLGHVTGLCLFLVALVHPELMQRMLPESPSLPLTVPVSDLSNETGKMPIAPKVSSHDNLQTWMYAKNWNMESLVAAILLTAASMVIALCLIYGTIRGISKYVTPFFCVQMFDLCLSGLTMLSYFSDLTAVRAWIAAQDRLPFKEQLLALDNDHLTLITLIIFITTLSIKAYFIGVVWSCYKYLKLHEVLGTQTRGRMYNSEAVNQPEDTEMLLPPKYEDVLLMPAEENPEGPPPPAYTPQ
jgi:lysosomal-associated transmembrane protein